MSASLPPIAPAPPSAAIFRRSIRNELLAILALGAAITVILLAWAQREFASMDELASLVNSAGRLRMLSQRTSLLTSAASAGEPEALAALAEGIREFEERAGALSVALSSYPELDTASMPRVMTAWGQLRDFVTDHTARRQALNVEHLRELRKLADAALMATDDNVKRLLPLAESRKQTFAILMPGSVLVSVVLLLVAMVFIQRRLLRPLRRMEAQFERLAEGDFSGRLSVHYGDEVGRVIMHANQSAQSLQLADELNRKVLAQLQDSEIRHRTLWAIASEAIIVIDASGTIKMCNPSVQTTFGYSPEQLLGKDISLIQPEHLRAAHRGGLERYLARGERKLNWRSIELNVVHSDGHEFPVELSFSEMQLTAGHWFVGTFRDITERKRHEEALVVSANYDSLTTLPNRNLLMDRIDQAIHVARRHSRLFGLLYLDLDNFKVINDSLGHERGDELLREASRRLLTCVRDGDTVARVGGDEFVLLLSDMAGQDDIHMVAQRALSMMEQVFVLDGSEAFVGASIGGSVFPEDGTNRSELMQHADIAMYRAKEYGRNNFQRYAGHMKARYKVRMSMEAQLRKAIAADELVLHYQPQIEVATGKVIGAEALIRWESPSLGRVSPAQFIPLAEETGLIVPIGAWVIERACRDAATWLAQPEGNDCSVAINLSARQFSDESLIDVVMAAMSANRVSPDRVEMEITESLVMQNPERAVSALRELKKLGCKVALDDFGTGYSSLAYLRSFPLDCLKIDKSLIQDVAIVRAVIQLSHSFGLTTLAEGVEDEAVLALLGHLGCDVVQGFYHSRPLPLEDFRTFLRRNFGAHSEERVP